MFTVIDSHQCSFLHFYQAHNHHHRRNGTSLGDSDMSQTHRCSGNCTRRCLRRWTRGYRVSSKCTYLIHTGDICAVPWHALLSSVGVNPISHSQRYPPGAFKHCPFSHKFTLSAHSSMSEPEETVSRDSHSHTIHNILQRRQIYQNRKIHLH